MSYKRLWVALAVVVFVSFGVLLYYGHEIYQMRPPIPERVVCTDGTVLFTGSEIHNGQNVWQSIGGQEIGTVWGHGAYVAPDWSADWLHREATWMLNDWSQQQYSRPYDKLGAPAQAALKARLQQQIRVNTYNPSTRVLTVSPTYAAAIRATAAHYTALFGSDPTLAKLRKDYAIPSDTIASPKRQKDLNAFFFWAAWACTTDRPGSEVTYTQNWPPESLVGNHAPPQLLLWSIASVILLLAGIGALTWHRAAHADLDKHENPAPPTEDPWLKLKPTPSMRATLKYFWTVVAMLLLQVGCGIITAHYGVDGNGFFGIPLAKWIPYAVTRTWHLQLGIFWIATAWLATGLFVAPAVSGHEPKHQKVGVNFLYVCLVIIVAGSMVGEWLGVMQKLGLTTNFWFGEQGYEYVDLGRFWQIFLFVGLLVWLTLLIRALAPALRKPTENKHLLALFMISAAAIGSFYAAGLMWGQATNLAIEEYWRWWVIHLWVEGFFEIFATVVIAFLFTRMGLLEVESATSAVIFSAVIFLAGGIIGTFHHLYFTGAPIGVVAFGASFSALEVVPLVLIGFEAYENLSLIRAREWVSAYRWPIYFFVAVGFWNLVGAGLFGFMINPPIALYYVQGLNTTAVHAHTALFGVYGMLGIGLMLFCLRALTRDRKWKTGAIRFAFWTFNLGLVLMVVLSLLPVGILQAVASVGHGMWYARSAQFLQTPLMQHLRWMRAIGDTVFTAGVFALAWFVLGLQTGSSFEQDSGDRILSEETVEVDARRPESLVIR